MTWYNKKSKIPNYKDEFAQMLVGFVVYCPSSIRKRKKINKRAKTNTKNEYNDVSVRDCSFRTRGITGALLRTILRQIKNPLKQKGTYVVVENGAVEEQVKTIKDSTTLRDENFELMVFSSHSNMPDTEAIYYYIRNAFAHGSFEIIDIGNKSIYKLESVKNGVVRAQMRLKCSTLKGYIELAKKTPAGIKALQKPKNKKQR